MPAFTGSLRANEIFGAIYNMIISQEVFADNLKHNYQLVDKFRTDGTMYGDTKLFYATDVLKSANWGGDSGASNLLTLHRPTAPSCQKITITNFRQIALTVDNYLSKRAWGDEGAFSSFTSVMLGWIQNTKKLYMATLFNAWIGTQESSTGAQSIDVDLPEVSTTSNVEQEASYRLRAQVLANKIVNLFDELKDYSRDYNDYGYMRSYDPSDLMVIWNNKYINEVTKLDLPTMYHQVGIEKFEEEKLPSRFFGTIITSSNYSSYQDSGTGSAGKPISSSGTYAPGTNHANGTIRVLHEMDVTVSGTTTHLFPGDELPSGASITTSNLTETVYVNGSSGNSVTNSLYYIVDEDIICKIVHKRSIPFMSAFETGTSFFNPVSLTENHYLTFGYSDLEYLKNYPFITINED